MRHVTIPVFWHLVLSTACLLGCAALPAQDLADPVKEGPESLAKMMKLWPMLSRSGNTEQHEQRPASPIFGRPTLKVVGSLAGGVFNRLDVLLISNGIGLVGPAFEEEYQKVGQELPAAYAERFGLPGESQPAPAGSPPGTQTMFWAAGEIGVSLILEPAKRVRLSLRPLTDKERATGLERVARARADKWRDQHVVRKPNDDVIIEDLPAVEVVVEGTENTPRTAQMLQKYYGWKVDLEALLKRLKGATGDESTDVIIMRELAAEAEVKISVLEGFAPLDVTQAIDRGHLAVIIFATDGTRVRTLRDFSVKQRKEPDILLPPVTDEEEKKKWPTIEDAPYSGISIVRGYNTRRGEIILAQPGWHSSYQLLRIRPEELKVGTYNTLLFSPNP